MTKRNILDYTVFIIYLLFSKASAVTVRDYNFVDVRDFSSRADLERALFPKSSQSEGGEKASAANNIVLAVAQPECWQNISSPLFRGSHRNGGGDYLVLATLPAAEFPSDMLKSCAQMFYYKVGAPNLKSPSSTNIDMGLQATQAWLWSILKVDMYFENGFDFSIEIFYKTESAEGMFQGTIQPGERMSMGTTIGHVFTAFRVSSDSRLNGQFVDYFIANGSPTYQFSWRNHLGNPGCVSEDANYPNEDGECNNVDLMFMRTHSSFGTKPGLH